MSRTRGCCTVFLASPGARIFLRIPSAVLPGRGPSSGSSSTALICKGGRAFFGSTHSGADLDLLVVRGSTRLGFEIKLTSSPKVTPSMKTALEVLGLERVFVMCYGDGSPWELARGITAVPAGNLSNGDWLPELSFPRWGS